MTRKSEIKFIIELDEKKLPGKIEWEATDAGFTGTKPCSSMMISLWDKDEKSTFGIDLWTKDMLIEDMNIHFYQTLQKMADTYLKATNNNEIAQMFAHFSSEFADKLSILKKVK